MTTHDARKLVQRMFDEGQDPAQNLPVNERKIIRAKHRDGFQYAQIAKMYDYSLSSVKRLEAAGIKKMILNSTF